MNYCCKDMDQFVNDKRDPIEYNFVFREYFISIKYSNNIIRLSYCPWCGEKLPESLRDKFFDVLEEEYGLELSIGELDDERIPKEFQSDEWWKKRGL